MSPHCVTDEELSEDDVEGLLFFEEEEQNLSRACKHRKVLTKS
jgi:hypothetical protein